MVGGDVGSFEHGGEFELAGGHFVVTGFGGDAEFEQFLLRVEHVGEDPFGDSPEVVVVELLAFGGLRPEQGASGV